jgi:hypothetical protein
VLREQLQEFRWIADNTPDTPYFLLVDNNSSPAVVAAHKSTLDSIDASPTQMLHFTSNLQETFVEKLLSAISKDAFDVSRLRELLLPKGISYGRGPNIATLVAISLDCLSTHRRDSDNYHDPSRPHKWPIELELLTIGRDIAEASLQLPDGVAAGFTNRTIHMAGSVMFGSPTIDRRDLFEAGEGLALQFQRLGRPNVTFEELRKEAREYLIEEPRTRYDSDFISVHESARIEMGNCAFHRTAFLMLPEMPTGILGCDYMLKDLIWRLKRPAVFHSRKLLHLYDLDRDQGLHDEQAVDYAIRNVQYIQVGRIWQVHGSRMAAEPDRFETAGRFDVDEYAASFMQASVESMEVVSDVRQAAADIYERSAAVAPREVKPRLLTVSRRLKELGELVDSQVHQAVEDFTYLAKAWPALTNAASEIPAVER